jgi:hypothetical protein
MKPLCALSLLLVLLAWAVSPAAAAPILLYNNLGPNPTVEGPEPDNASDMYNTDSASAGPITSFALKLALAQRFTPTTTDTFHSLELGLGYLTEPAGPPTLIVKLVRDAAGKPSTNPADVLETFTFSTVPLDSTLPSNPGTVQEGVDMGPVSAHPLLTMGTPYWVTVTDGTAFTFGEWFQNSTLATGTLAGSLNGGATWPLGASGIALSLEVEGDPIPEPSTLAVLLVALVGLAGYHTWQRRRSGLTLALSQCR